jgi:hypothetical protein
MDLEVVNKVRQMQGMEPLTELPKDVENPAATPTAEEIEAKRIADEATATIATAAAEAEKKKNQDKPTPDADPELSDDQLIKLLAKKGITVASVEELKKPAAPPDPAKEAELREANELAYGLQKGLFNKKDYDGFVHDSQSPQDFVYAQYHAEAKADDPELTDEDIQSEFLSKYGLDAEPGTRKHKRGTKEINTIAESLLKQKYGKIYEAKSSFSSHEKETTTAAQDEAKVVAESPTYQKDVDEIFTSLKKIPVKFSDTESVEVDAIEESLNAFKVAVLKPEFVKKKILAGYTKEQLKEEIFAGFLYKNFPAIAQQVANQHLLKHSAGTKGIPNLGCSTRKEVGETIQLTDAQKKAKAIHDKQAAAVAN